MIALLLMSQVVVPAGASTTVEPATGWHCRYSTSDGREFALSGIFPEFPVGSPANVPLPTTIEGDGEAFLLGPKRVNSYSPKDGKRVYQVSFSDAVGDRYNLNFELAKEGGSPVDITHWIAKEERLVTFASGHCTADFTPEQNSK